MIIFVIHSGRQMFSFMSINYREMCGRQGTEGFELYSYREDTGKSMREEQDGTI